MADEHAIPEIAFYYPGHLWHSGEWIKNLLLFFDGIGLLVPHHKLGEAELIAPEIAEPLKDRGLLHILEPEQYVNQAATEQLTDALTEVITSGALDDLAAEGAPFHTLSYSRLGGYGDSDLADMVHEELMSRGLARQSEDGLSIPMHPLVRNLVLTLLAQILRPAGENIGAELSPATDRPEVVDALREVLSLASPSVGNVVTADLRTVGVDLSLMPMNEVLAFRDEHAKEFQNYAQAVRRFASQLSRMPAEERRAEMRFREDEIKELARLLERESNRQWKMDGAFALGLVGTTLAGLQQGSAVAAMVAGVSQIIGHLVGQERAQSSYSYLFYAGGHMR